MPDGGATATLIGAAVAAVSGTASLTQAGLSMPYNVTCKLTIRNYTRWPLVSSVGVPESGYIKQSPSAIRPGAEEYLHAHKPGGTATGTSGTISFKLDAGRDQTVRPIIMWSVPYSHDFHTNWLGVGVLHGKDDKKNFNRMYHDSEDFFRRNQYYSSTDEVRYDDHLIYITGTLGTSHQPEGVITIVPKNDVNFSQNIKLEAIRSSGYVEAVRFENYWAKHTTRTPEILKASHPGAALTSDAGGRDSEWQLEKGEDGRAIYLRNPFLDVYLTAKEGGLGLSKRAGPDEEWEVEPIAVGEQIVRINSRSHPDLYLTKLGAEGAQVTVKKVEPGWWSAWWQTLPI